MKKSLLVLSLFLSVAVAQALPFVPTTSPQTEPIHWYYLKTGGRFVYAHQSDDADIAASTSSQENDAYYWCFVGDSNNGYRIYNRATNSICMLANFSVITTIPLLTKWKRATTTVSTSMRCSIPEH